MKQISICGMVIFGVLALLEFYDPGWIDRVTGISRFSGDGGALALSVAGFILSLLSFVATLVIGFVTSRRGNKS